MEPDNNEAYIHNVCKKTAQLARVASDFNNLHIDQVHKIKQLRKYYYNYFDSIVEQARKNAQEVFNKLIAYRKLQIEDACHQYGLEYKQIKSDFAHCLNEQSAQLNNISREAKQQNRNIKEITRDSILLAKSVLSTADEVKKSLKAQIKCNSPIVTPEIKVKMDEIKMKTEVEKKRSQQAISDMKQYYREIANEIKNQVRAIIFEEIRHRKAEFTELLTRTRNLKADAKSLKEQRKQLIEELKKQLIDAKEKRDNMVNTTKTQYKKLLEEKQRVSAELKKENSQGTDKVNNAKQLLKTSRINQQKMIKEINMLIEKQRVDSRDIEKSIAQRRKERMEQLSQQQANFMQQQKSEMQMKIEEIRFQQQIIEERKLTTDYLDDKSHELYNMFMKELGESKSKFASNLSKMEFDVQTYFNEQKSQYTNHNNDQIDHLKEMFTDISDESRHNRKIVRKASHRTKKEIAETIEKNAEAIKQKEKDNEQEKAKFQEQLNQKKNEKIEINEKRANQVIASNDKKKQQIQATFDSDLEKKKKEVEEKHHIEEKTYSLADEESEFKHRRDKLEAELDYRVRAIDNAKTHREKTLNQCETTLVELDKKKRMLERASKDANDNIIQEFEMQIQVAQVELADKIDKLSALYDKEENARGAQIIEAIRKVLQTKNRLRDLKLKITEETEEKMKKIEAEKKATSEEIEALSSGTKEKKLNEEYEKMQKELDKEVQDMENTTDKLKSEIIKAIEKEKEEIERQKAQIAQVREMFDKDYEEKLARLNEKNDKLKEKTEEKKLEIIDVYNEKKAELEKEYNHSAQNMQSRINFAKQNLAEEKESCNKKFTAEVTKYREEWEQKSEKLPTSAQRSINELLQVNTQLHDKIDTLSQSLSNLVYQYYSYDSRTEEKNKVEELKKQCDTYLNDIAETFKPLIGHKMRKLNHPVFYKTIATNTDTGPIPPSAYETPKTNLGPLAQTPTSGHRARASIVFPKSSRISSENLLY